MGAHDHRGTHQGKRRAGLLVACLLSLLLVTPGRASPTARPTSEIGGPRPVAAENLFDNGYLVARMDITTGLLEFILGADGAEPVSLAVAGLDVRALSAALGAAGEGKITGKLTGQLALSAGPPGGSAGDARLADRLVGRGRIFLDDGDLWSVPVVSWLFGRLGLERQRSALSDAHAVFTIRGPVLHIRRAVVANPLAGIECRKGTVNVRTHQVDAVVVAGTFVTANPLSRLLLGELRAKLMGRRVRGKWDELGAKDFVPLPAGKIAESSVKLFHQLARSGGDLSAEIGKTFDELFKRLKP